jgi:DnaJ-class molecular chaperone
VALLKHAKFARDGKNIYSEEHIDVLTAILGGKREVEVLGG